ncbi:MAG TPA: ABC transporter permease [bacterium]|uniref:Lipoprotein-releasing system transmembrane protein LolE n=1 Tax=candidate division TA06 bacterium ADurb.Bin417 TaxID=1852828 RepID=A0A1V5MJE4_UNCT6|nr:MAG: Lipoprotein-releasing system transmembrane protein LolE [candidate division TA06 bacterium ADurb.Bin417]HNQ34555.1 ABC transporter permease [bacterium]HNS49239.1 ABC transporter permease [bacterium]
MNYTFFIARRYFRRSRGGYLFLTSLFAIISVAVGVACLILVLGVMNGFDRDLKRKIIGVQPAVTIQLPAGSGELAALERRLQAVPEVLAVSPFSETQAILRSREYMIAVLVRAVDFKREDAVTGFGKYLDPARPDPGLVLGAELARSLRAGPGDQLQVITGFGMLPGRLPVTGRFQTGLYHFDASLAYLPLERGGALFPRGSRPEALGVKVADIYAASETARRISRELGPEYKVESWIDRNQALFGALALERRAMAAILILIVMVAGFNIATSLMMTVWRKSREIGTLRSLGVSRGGIRAIFLWMGFLTGLWGILGGLGVGLSLAYLGDRYRLIKLPGYVYDLSYLPIQVRGTDVLWIVLSAFSIALLASIFPAQEASRVAPAVTLRSE